MEKIKNAWAEIIRGKDRHRAVMDADKLLDHALGLMGYKGNMGAKLKKSGRLFRNIDHIWKAHKIRNDIAHQVHFKLAEKTYHFCISTFRQAFRDLKVF